jgi:hypothetical protein
MELKDLRDRDLPELQKLLLIQAFGGRPVRVVHYPGYADYKYSIIIEHENGQHHVHFRLADADLELLTNDLGAFKQRIVDPIIHNLDSAAYPERGKRLMPTFRRVAELMANGRL